MVHIIKVYFKRQNDMQIRRLAVSSDTVSRFDLLASKIREMYPNLTKQHFEVTWKDPENDVIHMSSDEELAQALANAEDGILRLYVCDCGQSIEGEKTVKAKSSHKEMHENVVCDSCDKNISGYRYKCLQCPNYDLCSDCNAADKHGNHDMIKLIRPAHISRNWVFLGSRKLWRSMFGRCPSFFNVNHQMPKEHPTTAPPESACGNSQWRSVVDDLLKGDYVPAEKLIKDNLGNFLNFVESVAGGVDVKIENSPFKTDSPKEETLDKADKKVGHETSLNNAQSASVPPLPKEVPKAEKVIVVPDEKETEVKKINHKEVSTDLVLDVPPVSPVDTALANKAESVQPAGLFGGMGTSMNMDGWTLVNEHEAESKDNSDVVNEEDKPETRSIYPDITGTMPGCASSQATASDASQDSKQNDNIPTTQDPQIMNAFIKMQAMGFTNEGGWLERLLIAKEGNINAALDALYPNARR